MTNMKSLTAFNRARVLITGGLGFLGSNLALKLVEHGAQVAIIDSLIPEYGGNLWNIDERSSALQVNISDVRDEHSMRYLIQGHDYLFNLAGQTSHLDSMRNPYPDLEINARAQLSILEACRRYNPGIKVVFASTRQLYGRPQYLPVDEQHPVAPIDVNGVNKLAGEGYHLVYHQAYGIRTAVLRLTNTYGPRMRVRDARQTFLGIWIRAIVEGKKFQIFGDGEQLRDFNYVDDVVDALLAVAASEEVNGQVLNLGADERVSLNTTADLLVKVAGSGSYEHIPFPSDRKAIDIGDYYGSYGKINSLLNWSPVTSLETGLARTVDFYRKHISHYVDASVDLKPPSS